jgi:hypothetical protein
VSLLVISAIAYRKVKLRMSLGLGMTEKEWDGLRKQVDDSFWVMRIIGYPPLPNDEDGFSCGAHKLVIVLFFNKHFLSQGQGLRMSNVCCRIGLLPVQILRDILEFY